MYSGFDIVEHHLSHLLIDKQAFKRNAPHGNAVATHSP